MWRLPNTLKRVVKRGWDDLSLRWLGAAKNDGWEGTLAGRGISGKELLESHKFHHASHDISNTVIPCPHLFVPASYRASNGLNMIFHANLPGLPPPQPPRYPRMSLKRDLRIHCTTMICSDTWAAIQATKKRRKSHVHKTGHIAL